MENTTDLRSGNTLEKLTKMGFGPSPKPKKVSSGLQSKASSKRLSNSIKSKPKKVSSGLGAELGKAALSGANKGISKSPFPNVAGQIASTVKGFSNVSDKLAKQKEKATKKQEKLEKTKAAEQAKAEKTKAAEQAKIAKNVRKNHENYLKQKAGIYKQKQAAQAKAAKAKIALERKQQQDLQAEGKSKLKEIKNSGSKYSMVKPKPITKAVITTPPMGKQRKPHTRNIPIDAVNKKPSVIQHPFSPEAIIRKMESK